MKRFLKYIFPVVVLTLFITFTSQQPSAQGGSSGQQNPATVKPSSASLDLDLPVVGSAERLKSLLKEAISNKPQLMYGVGTREQSKELASVADASANKAKAESVEDYSSTNLQVQGVDEADIVKTDGKYIYQVNHRRVLITQAYPAENMQLVKTLSFGDKNFHPIELYVDENNLVVIGSTNFKQPSATAEILPPNRGQSSVKALVYDLRNKEKPEMVREVELEGHYLSSRKIGSALYLVANKGIDYYYIMEDGSPPPPTPVYRDSSAGDGFVPIDCEKIRYFPDSAEPNYLLIGSLDLSQPDQEMEVNTYVGSGNNIYASTDNLYVTVTQYSQQKPEEVYTDSTSAKKKALVLPAQLHTETAIYKYALDNGQVAYQGKGVVPGTILNQFSMDEYVGHFRIATTKGQIWGAPENPSTNNVYVLDQAMKLTGSLEDIAPGERIYSTRFMGDRLYMVTFKKVDPLFVIDLKEPDNPAILGALKIPGYSDYLHPYDENHIIGFGKDTVEASGEDFGGDQNSFAYYQGMKLALFDVSDVSNPIEKHKVIIGDRGTDSELLHNHKALLFNREKNLLAFPVTLMEVKNKKAGDLQQYGEFTFQGLFVYQLDPFTGFDLRGKITHVPPNDYKKAGREWYNSKKNVERALYIGNNLYTLSRDMIKANDLQSLREIKSIHLK